MEIVPREDVVDIEDKDSRNTKRMYLETDAICARCGCIINSYYENRCIMCNECGGEDLISGKVGINLRLLLDFSFNELRGLADIRGCRISSRPKIIVDILKMLHPEINIKAVYRTNLKTRYINIDESLIWKMIKRESKRLWYVKDIDYAMSIIKMKKVEAVISKTVTSKVATSKAAISKAAISKAGRKKHNIKIRLLSEDEVIIDGNH